MTALDHRILEAVGARFSEQLSTKIKVRFFKKFSSKVNARINTEIL